MTLHIVLVILDIIGLYISTYFSLVYYNLISPDTRLVPAWCRMDNNTCELVVHTPQGRLFRPPNSILGILYYLTQIVFLALSPWIYNPVLPIAMITLSAIPFTMSLYLVYTLRVQLKTDCILCYTCNGINILLFFIYIVFKAQL